MKNSNVFEIKGTVIENLKGMKFRVKLDDIDREVICTVKGKLVKNNIRIIVGDKVDVEIDTVDVTKGKITWRYK